MWTHRISRPVARAVIHPSRFSGGWLATSPLRYYATHKTAPKGHTPPREGKSSSNWLRTSLGLVGTAVAVFAAYTYATNKGKLVEKPVDPSTQRLPKFGDFKSSLYAQRKKSLKSPGVYLWGANQYRVADPESKESVIKSPRKVSYFDGQVLRDLKCDEKSAAAITEDGDLIQWGKGFSETDFKPTKTLTGKNLTSVCMSRDRILALSSDGKVYSVPISRQDQLSGRKARDASWLSFWSGTASISYRLLQPHLGLTEKVTAISGGLDHALLLTSSGRVFSVASATERFPTFGQLGIPGLIWSTRPKGPVDTCHEVSTLKGAKIAQISTGDYHSLALSKDGRVFSFGDNSFGQLGLEFQPGSPSLDTPTVLSLKKVYPNTMSPKVTGIAAGGANSFFTVDARRTLGPEEDPESARDVGRITADMWTCGRGIWGALGNGRWTHLQDAPTKVKALSGLSEYDERNNQISPIRLRQVSVGTTHVSAVMDNQPHLDASKTETLDRLNDWGYDVLWWGGNEQFQLGTGKRSNSSKPVYINASSDQDGDGKQQETRLQIMPRHKGKVGNRTVSMEQKVECGRHVSAIYSAK